MISPFLCEYGYNINIGSNVSIESHCRIMDTCKVILGNNVLISPGVSLICTIRNLNPRAEPGIRSTSIIIKNDVWIGDNATILDGVRITKGCTVTLSAVLYQTKTTPDSIIGGNPAKVFVP